ncbi:MAG: hypothetical protein MZV70_67215 [Desulfobacterales bacterium]|nr:hypothetical protein [Desulfobacterales bacterium]
MVRQRGAELILHGHIHRRSRNVPARPRGPHPRAGRPSASATSPDPAPPGRLRRRTGSPALPTGWETTLQDHWYCARDRSASSPAP